MPRSGRPSRLIKAWATLLSTSHQNGHLANCPHKCAVALSTVPIHGRRCRQSPAMPEHRTIAPARTIRPGIPSVSDATFWRLISCAHRSAAIDHQALINRIGCIKGYKIRNADISKSNVVHMYYSTSELQYICTIAERHNAIIVMLWFLVNNNGIMIMLWFMLNNNGSVIMHYHDSVICGYNNSVITQYRNMRNTAYNNTAIS